MANRVTVPVTNFESLSPPWSLASLDSDLLALQGALNDSSLGYVITGTDTGSANNYVIATPTFGIPSAYQSGMTVAFLPAHTNTGASTLNVAGLGAQAIMTSTGQVFPGSIGVGNPVMMTYIGSAFQLVSTAATPVQYYTTSPGVGFFVNCQGASSVVVGVNWTSPGGSSTINLQNLSYGIPVMIDLINTSTGPANYALGATDPSAATLSPVTSFATSSAGGAVVYLNTVQTLNAGTGLFFSGMAVGGTLFLSN